MPAAGLCLTGVIRLSRGACDIMGGGRHGLAPPLCWCGILPMCEWIFADSSWSSLGCKWIFADSSWSLWINCSCLKWILAGSSTSLWINNYLSLCGWIKLPALTYLQKFQTILVSMGVRWVLFHWTGFSVTVPVGSCLLGWFPLTDLLYGYLPALAWTAQAPCQPLSSHAHLLAMSLTTIIIHKLKFSFTLLIIFSWDWTSYIFNSPFHLLPYY